MNIKKPLIVTQIKISLCTVNRYETLAMLVGIQSAGINIDVRIKLLNGDRITPGLKKLCQGSRNNTFAQR